MREASRRLSQSLFDSYENDWAGEEDLGGIVEVSDTIRGNLKTSRSTSAHSETRPGKDLSLCIINAMFMLCLLIRGRTSYGMTTK